LTLALESSQMGIFDWDLTQKKVTWSDSTKRLYGYGPGEFHGRIEEVKKRIHPEDLARFERALKSVFEGNQDYDIAYRVVWPDRSIHWVYAKGKGIPNEEGIITRFMGTAIDITSAKIAEERERLLGLVG